jgi:hypothetical protein
MTKSRWWAGAIERLEERRGALWLASGVSDNCAEEPPYLSTIDELATCGLRACHPLFAVWYGL